MKTFAQFNEAISAARLAQLDAKGKGGAARQKMKADNLKSSKSSDPLAAAAPNVKKIAPATKASAQSDPLKKKLNQSRTKPQSKALPPSSSSTSKPGALTNSPKTQMVKRNTGTSAKKVDNRIKSQQAKPNSRTRVPDKTYPANKPPQKERFSDKVDKKIGDVAKKAGSKLGDGLKKAPGAALRGAGKIGKAVVGAKSGSLGSVKGGLDDASSQKREYGDSRY